MADRGRGRRRARRRSQPLAQAFDLPLPESLREGYHRIAILRGGAAIGEGVLIVAPDACYLPPAIAAGARIWGAALQLYGLRSERNAGIGDFTDLTAAVETWAERGGGIVGTNPLHSLCLRDPGNASPYSPGSRLFVNPIYIGVEAVEDFRELGERGATVRRWHDEKEQLRASALVDYAAVAAAKRAILGKCHASSRSATWQATRRARIRAVSATRGQALRRHAIHEALEGSAPNGRSGPRIRDPASEGTRRFAEEHAEDVAFHSTSNGRQTSARGACARARDRNDEAMPTSPSRWRATVPKRGRTRAATRSA
jgi:(1->4)-alpha-D-glucan 1-alpha-D-glucosylmutase